MKALLLSIVLIAAPQIQSADLVWPTIDIEPFSFGPNSKEAGLNHDLVDEISKRTGIKFKMKRESKAKTLNDMRNGSGHFTFGYRNKDTDSYLDPVICVFVTPVLAFSRKGLTMKRVEDLRGFKNGIGFILGSGATSMFDSDPAVKKVPQDSYEQMFASMKAEKLDAAVGSGLGLSYFIKQTSRGDMVGDKLEVGGSEYCVLVEKSRIKLPETLKVIAAVEAMKREGIPDKLISKYEGR